MKVEIDLTKEIEEVIQKEVEKQLDNGGLLRFIRTCVSKEFKDSGSFSQLKRHESILTHLKRSADLKESENKSKAKGSKE